MADQRKVELILGIRTEGATDASQGLASIGKAAETLGGELTKLQRADALKDLGAVAAQVGTDIGDLDAAAAELANQLKAVGASEAEIRKVSKAFDDTVASIEKANAAEAKLNDTIAKDAEKAIAAQEKLGAAMARDIEKQIAAQEKLGAAMAKDIDKSSAAAEKLGEQEAFAAAKARDAASGASVLQQQLGQISRADQIEKLATDMGTLAKKTGDVSGSVAKLDEQLKELGATEEEIKGAGTAFDAAQNADDSGGKNLLQRAGTGLRGLPSIQIPGTGIGTDAIASITRLTGSLGELTGVTTLMATATTALTPALGATAAGIAGVSLVAAPIIIVLGALALALKGLGDEAAKESKAINSTIDAQRAVNDEIAKGLSQDDIKKKIEETNAARAKEAELLARNQRVYDENINSAGALAPVLKVVSGAEDALSGQIQKSKDLIEGYDATQQALTGALDQGKTATNDAAEAEKKLADERSKAALTDADNAGKELAAQQKALAATEEQNQKRLTSIGDEKAVIQAQIDVLTKSGVTSDEVTKKLASLNGQIGELGKESDFIKNTALEVSKQRDAEVKAKKDAEDAAKKAQQAQDQYTKAVDNASRSYKNSVQDIGTRASQQLADNEIKRNRDLTDINTKYARDQYDLTIKSNRAERDAALSQADTIQQIRENSNKAQTDAIQQGDFKALFLARQKEAQDIAGQQKTIQDTSAKRLQSERDARQDLGRSFDRQRSDRLNAYERQTADARTSQQRELQQASLTRQRALQVASEGLNAELGQYQSFWKQFNAVGAAGMKQALQIASGQSKPASNNSPFGAAQNFSAGGLGRIIRK